MQSLQDEIFQLIETWDMKVLRCAGTTWPAS